MEAIRRALDLIGLAGIPDALATWKCLLSRVNAPFLVAPILVLVLISYAFWPDISKNLKWRRVNHDFGGGMVEGA